MRLEIEVWPDYVLIDGQRVDRRPSISPSQWLEFWARASNVRGHDCVV